MTNWIDGGNGWWTRKIPDDGFCAYVTGDENKWFIKIGNLPCIGPLESQAAAFKAAELKAMDIAKAVQAELTEADVT